MNYQAYTNNELTLRDALAFDRTIMANERTLLAYLRSALALLAGGLTLYKFFPQDANLQIMGVVLFISGIITVIFGLIRFSKVRKSLNILTKGKPNT